MSEWISVKDRLPEYGKEVLFFCIRKNNKGDIYLKYSITGTIDMYDSFRYLSDDGEKILLFFSDVIITHWMYLPEPPKD